MKNIIIFFIFYTFSSITFGQNIWDVYKKVEKKLAKDSKYLDLYSIDFTPTAEELPYLQNIPLGFSKGTYSFDGQSIYTIVFIKETIEIDSVLLLYVTTVKTSGGSSDTNSFIANAGSEQIDTAKVLSYTDVQELYFSPNNRKFYNELYRIVLSTLQEQEPKSLLGIEINKSLKKSKGYSSENNVDFVNYMRMNAIHKYPRNKIKVVQRRGRVKEGEAQSTEFDIDASLSHATFTHKVLEFPFYSLSAEVNLADDFLNLLPYQNMTLSGGIRGLVTFSEDEQDILKDIILDVSLLGKGRLNLSNIAHKIPFIFVDSPTLNINSGFTVNILASQLYNLPFLNLYFSSGSSDFTDPSIKFGTKDSSYAYFSSTQWRFLFSFFWNASEKADLRMKMDIGLGGHNIVEAIYQNKKVRENLLDNKIKPIIGFNLSFVPKNTELINLNLRYYDNIIKGDVWFKVFEMSPHLFRLGGVFLSSPLFRKDYVWENGSGGMVQVHYRFGFN